MCVREILCRIYIIVLLQFGDLEVSRAYVVVTGQNETYPVVPHLKKFRWSLPREELVRVTTGDPCTWEHRPIPIAHNGVQRIQPSEFLLPLRPSC